MLPTVQAHPQESAPPTKPKQYALPPPPKPPKIVAHQGPELLEKDRLSPNGKDSSALSPRSFARNARSKNSKDSSPTWDEAIEDFIILDDDIEDTNSPEENRRYSSDNTGSRRSPEVRRKSPEATTADLYDDLVPIDVDAMPDNTPYETRDSRIEYQEAQIPNQNP